MTSLALAALAIFLLAQAEGTQRAGLGFAEEVIDKNGFSHGRSFDPQFNPPPTFRRNSRSMSFVDYFFPASRQAKVSENFKSQRQLVEIASTQSQSTEYVPETTLITTKSIAENIESTTPASDDMFSVTIEEGRATGSSKKGTTVSGKRKSTSRVTTATPKTKASQKVSSQSTHGSSISHSTKATQKATTTKPVTKQDTTYANTNTKTTHKHYTIHPSVESTKANPPSSSYKTKQPDRITTKISNSASSQTQTTVGQKVTLAELAKVTEDMHPESSSGSEVGTTEVNAREGELDLREKPIKHQVEISAANKNESVPLPDGSTSVLAKPTKYHYYPHNQHIYLLPECAIQQVCNAVYVRLNYTQPLCACPSRHRDPCSASLNADDLHTTQLSTDSKKKVLYAAKAITLVKTCEATSEMRECRSPRDWSLLALQNIRTGKSHYLVICRCPEECVLEGPMSHDQPTYASVPGIRVYGMMCIQPQQNQYTSQSQAYNSVTSRPATSSYKVGYSQPGYNQEPHMRYPEYANPGVYYNRMARKVRETEREESPPFPWEKARELALTADWEN